MSIKELRKRINKKAGMDVSYDLSKDNPSDVKQWIPTGSRWLDSIICRGKRSGVPCGKIVEVAGAPAAGKSYLAALIALNAHKLGFDIVFFDSESSVDSDFLQRMGLPIDDILYIQAKSVEFVLQTIEDLLAENEKPMLFIWDSLSMTACESDIQGNFDPQSQIAMKPRILSRGFKKLMIPMANHGSTFLVVNQLYTNIMPADRSEVFTNPYVAHGGRALRHAFSLAIWLTPRKGKASYVIGEDDTKIGSEVKATIEKSRWGSFGRQCEFKILWAGKEIAIQDKDSWLDVVKKSPLLETKGPWYSLNMGDGTEKKFQKASWLEKLENEAFHARVLEIMDDVLIHSFSGEKEKEEKSVVEDKI